ncbi:hypothetical protein PDESU_04320 [Pontiella desulfatans]|uniref:Uncharacterized protein n=1 Tax=Pontiella desulfatans TaxID=2750659 RepID=A0A6C2U724_PONDE|nr:hypothetical protein PDESU_04320 [Pontiella desulfatans]
MRALIVIMLAAMVCFNAEAAKKTQKIKGTYEII